jgi:chromosome segregation ATPase
LIAAAAEELPGRSLAPLTDYLIGTSEELDYRKASIRALSNTLSKVESNLAQRVQEVAHLAHRLTESDQNGADLQRRIGESEAAHRRERDRCAQLQLERDRLRAELDKVESARSQLQAAVVQRDDLIRSVYQSTSWKILRPIRAISRLFARAAKQ